MIHVPKIDTNTHRNTPLISLVCFTGLKMKFEKERRESSKKHLSIYRGDLQQYLQKMWILSSKNTLKFLFYNLGELSLQGKMMNGMHRFRLPLPCSCHIDFRGTPYQSVPIRTISSREPADFSQRPDFKYGFVRMKTDENGGYVKLERHLSRKAERKSLFLA